MYFRTCPTSLKILGYKEMPHHLLISKIPRNDHQMALQTVKPVRPDLQPVCQVNNHPIKR
jgi:hypothetical protein